MGLNGCPYLFIKKLPEDGATRRRELVISTGILFEVSMVIASGTRRIRVSACQCNSRVNYVLREISRSWIV